MLAAIVSAKLYSLKPSEIQRVSVDSVHKDSGDGAPKRHCQAAFMKSHSTTIT